MRKFVLPLEYISGYTLVGNYKLRAIDNVVGFVPGSHYSLAAVHNHPRFSNFRYRLERMEYILTRINPLIGDVCLKDFSLNGVTFKKGDEFPRAEILSVISAGNTECEIP